MDAGRLVLLGLAAAVAAIINSVAGGGSLISFPALLALGVPPVIASATNTAALTPGGVSSAVAYRAELRQRWPLTLLFAAFAALGGVVGARVLLAAPPRVFELVVPWLIGGATLLLIVQDRLAKPARAGAVRAPTSARVWLVALGFAVIAVYGGYFGAGIGMLTLALLALLGSATLNQQNAMKCVIVASINAAATLYFLVAGRVQLVTALVMAVGAMIGGYSGAAIARRADPRRVRWAVAAIGIGLTLALAVRYYR